MFVSSFLRMDFFFPCQSIRPHSMAWMALWSAARFPFRRTSFLRWWCEGNISLPSTHLPCPLWLHEHVLSPSPPPGFPFPIKAWLRVYKVGGIPPVVLFRTCVSVQWPYEAAMIFVSLAFFFCGRFYLFDPRVWRCWLRRQDLLLFFFRFLPVFFQIP